MIGDARSQPPALRLRERRASLLKLPPLGEHKWSLPRQHDQCAASVRIDCALCAGVQSQARALEPRVVRVGCTSVRLAWEAPRPPFWGVGVPAPLQYRLHIEVPPLGSSPAAEIIVPAENADAGMRSGGASREEEEDDEDEDGKMEVDEEGVTQHANVDGLTSGTTYAMQLAAALPSSSASVVSKGWTAYGPPLLLTTSTSSDTGGWPLGIEVATEGQVAAAASRVGYARQRFAEAALGFGDACTQIHLLIPPATDCDGVSLLIEWLPPSVDA